MENKDTIIDFTCRRAALTSCKDHGAGSLRIILISVTYGGKEHFGDASTDIQSTLPSMSGVYTSKARPELDACHTR